MKSYRVRVKVTLCRVIDVRAVDEYDAVNDAEHQTIDSLSYRAGEELSSGVVDDDEGF